MTREELTMLAQINLAVQAEIAAGTMPEIFRDVVPSDVAAIGNQLLKATDKPQFSVMSD